MVGAGRVQRSLCWVSIAEAASHYSGFSCCGTPPLGLEGFINCGAQEPGAPQAQQLWSKSLVTPWHMGFSWMRDQTHVSWTGRQILSHWTIRVVPFSFFAPHLTFRVLSFICIDFWLIFLICPHIHWVLYSKAYTDCKSSILFYFSYGLFGIIYGLFWYYGKKYFCLKHFKYTLNHLI